MVDRFVYIAAPYRAATSAERAENVRRAGVLSRLALHLKFAPVCVLAAVEAGHFGRDGVPEDREEGLNAATALCRMVAKQRGQLWIIMRDDGTLSEGCRREEVAYNCAVAREAQWVLVKTWAAWDLYNRRVLEAGGIKSGRKP